MTEVEKMMAFGLLILVFLVNPGPIYVPDEPAAAPAEKSEEKAPEYLFGAKFEPPKGTVIHGMGQWKDDNRDYVSMLGDPAILPLTQLLFFGIDSVRPWEMTMDMATAYLAQEVRAGRVPFLTLELHGANKRVDGRMRVKVEEPFGIDDQVARTDRFDGRIAEVADLCRRHGSPIFFRIGGEFNGPWNGYHPFDYPEAFRKVVRIFRERGVENAAFIWSYEPSAPNDFDAKDADGRWKWFPGEEYIDWFALDVFARRDFSAAFPAGPKNRPTERGRSERFLALDDAELWELPPGALDGADAPPR